jgi:hypothetical protein
LRASLFGFLAVASWSDRERLKEPTDVLEPLAIPISGANLLVKTLQAKIAEAKAIAAKQPKQP